MPDDEQPVTTRLVLLRHGESTAMVDGVVGGHDGCKGLSPRGREQAEALRDRLASTGELTADVLLSSILPRAVETAEIIAPALGTAPLSSHCDYCEIHPGESDGMRWEDYRATYGFDPVLEPERPLSPGGESLRTFRARVVAAIDRVLEEHAGRTVVLVCHGGVIVAASRHLLGLADVDPTAALWLDVDPTGITEWTVEGDVHKLRRFNDAAHLPPSSD